LNTPFCVLNALSGLNLTFVFFFGTKRQTKNNFRGAGLGFFS